MCCQLRPSQLIYSLMLGDKKGSPVLKFECKLKLSIQEERK